MEAKRQRIVHRYAQLGGCSAESAPRAEAATPPSSPDRKEPNKRARR